jgi:hypothetical protein
VRVPRQTLGNVVRGHNFLPGSLLLPWLSDRLGDGVVRAAITGGQLVARNALPDVGGARGVSAPLALSRIRRAENGKPPLENGKPPLENGKPSIENGKPPLVFGDPPKGYRQVRARWTAAEPDGDVVRLQQPALAQVSRNAVERSRQRPTSEAGIYELEVIPAGRTLRSRVLISPALRARLREDHGDHWWQRSPGRPGSAHAAAASTARPT